MITTRKPAEVFPPGEFIRDELDERGWTQADLADILGRPAPIISELIQGKRRVSPELAKELSAAFGTSAEVWLNLESAYQLWKAGTGDPDPGVSRRATLYSLVPIKEMTRRGWLEPTESIDVLEGQVLSYLEIGNLTETPALARAHAARKSTSYQEKLTPKQLAWLYRSYHISKSLPVERFDREKLENCTDQLRQLVSVPQNVRHVPKVLGEAGIRFVAVQSLQGSKIDGACILQDETPTIAVTLRFDRLDNFWFVLMHEFGHLVYGDEAIDIDLGAGDASEKPEREHLADTFAAETLIPRHELDAFIARVSPLYSRNAILAFAESVCVHPAIVIGQLQHRGELAFSNHRKLLVPVRKWLAGSTLMDGWGPVRAA